MRLINSEATSQAISEMASLWKIGSNKITLAPTTTAIAVRLAVYAVSALAFEPRLPESFAVCVRGNGGVQRDRAI